MTEMTRREALAGVAGTGVLTLAGCVSSDGSAEPETGDEPTTDSPTEDMTPTASIERIGSDCAGSEPGEATVFLDGESFVVVGTTPAPTPCYDPKLGAVGVEDDTLSMTVDVTRSRDACDSCLGKVHYRADLAGLDPDAVDRVSVAHAEGETYQTPAGEITPGPPAVRNATLAETNGDARSSSDRGRAEFDRPENGTLSIDGAIPTNHPHYAAVLESATVQGTTLSVTVDVESTDEGRAGTMPLGIVEYTAEIELDHAEALDSVTVTHPDGSYGGAWASESVTEGE